MKNVILTFIVLLALSSTAWAGGTVRAGTFGYEAIEAGVFELGLDNVLLVNYSSENLDADGNSKRSELRASYIGGLSPRYFVANNFSVALNLDLFLGQQTVTDTIGDEERSFEFADVGFLGLVMANYYLRLGNSLFFKPGLGGGVFFGTRSTPGIEDGVKLESSLSGGAARLDLGLVYYASANFNMKAGLDALLWFGSVTDAQDVSMAYSTLDAGFNVGIAYSF